MSELTRRQFCVITGAGLVAGACGGGSSGSDGGIGDLGKPADMTAPLDLVNPECPINGKLYAGPASTFTVGMVTFFGCSRVLVARDATGLYAMTSICPHEQCDVAFAPSTHDFQCPCHLSTFDFDGTVTMGPATTSLVHYAVSLDGAGNVVVDLQTTVDPATRLAVQE
ncbi:MAG TPA: Rieske (2Fe-2S) protein [Polyangia bacterium]|jgi:Rieske Fe-S protein|nr:Rieske (2Fe-2S) protein [Polyangia bacterium]